MFVTVSMYGAEESPTPATKVKTQELRQREIGFNFKGWLFLCGSKVESKYLQVKPVRPSFFLQTAHLDHGQIKAFPEKISSSSVLGQKEEQL